MGNQKSSDGGRWVRRPFIEKKYPVSGRKYKAYRYVNANGEHKNIKIVSAKRTFMVDGETYGEWSIRNQITKGLTISYDRQHRENLGQLKLMKQNEEKQKKEDESKLERYLDDRIFDPTVTVCRKSFSLPVGQTWELLK